MVRKRVYEYRRLPCETEESQDRSIAFLKRRCDNQSLDLRERRLANDKEEWEEVHSVFNEHTSEATDAPDLTNYTCDIFDMIKMGDAFPIKERKEKMNTLRRCWTCFTCTVCCLKHADKTGFYHGTAQCRNCRYNKCDVCEMIKTITDFSDS